MVIPCTFTGAPWTTKPAFEYNFAQLVFAQTILYVRANFPGMQAAPLTKIMNFEGATIISSAVWQFLICNLGAHGLQPIVCSTPNARKPPFQNLDDIYKPFAATDAKYNNKKNNYAK